MPFMFNTFSGKILSRADPKNKIGLIVILWTIFIVEEKDLVYDKKNFDNPNVLNHRYVYSFVINRVD